MRDGVTYVTIITEHGDKLTCQIWPKFGRGFWRLNDRKVSFEQWRKARRRK